MSQHLRGKNEMARKLSKKQMKIARVAEPRDKITAADFKKLRNPKKMQTEKRKFMV
jgi:hypothetical protein|tara:strand:- start:1553 stop:1720 length:168 start_codon:yes stop_codon:yes gene_type:complete